MPLLFGLASDVGNKGRTVVCLSAGVYDSRTSSVLFLRVFTNNDLVTKDYSLDERWAQRRVRRHYKFRDSEQLRLPRAGRGRHVPEHLGFVSDIAVRPQRSCALARL